MIARMDPLLLLDIIGTVAFAVSGVQAAMAKRLDLFGILIMAFVTAIGGGTLRDFLVGDFPVVWIRHIGYTLVILMTVALTLLFSKPIGNFRKTLLLFDSVGIGFFTIVGVQKGMVFDLHPGICVVLGTVTACFGGVIRDILLNNIPIIFRKEIYASACIIGGSLYLLLVSFLPIHLAEVLSIATVIFIRILAVKSNWHLPNVYKKL